MFALKSRASPQKLTMSAVLNFLSWAFVLACRKPGFRVEACAVIPTLESNLLSGMRSEAGDLQATENNAKPE